MLVLLGIITFSALGLVDKFNGALNYFHGQIFVSRVAQGRKRPAAQIEPLAQGRVWTGEQAKQNGLVDQLGGIDAAIDVMRKRVKISPSERVTLVVYPPKKSLLEILTTRNDDTAAVEAKLETFLGGVPLHTLSTGGFLKLMPFAIRVK